MEVISPLTSAPRPSIGPLLGSVIVGTLLIVGGVVLAYLAFATPILGSVLPSGRPTVGQIAAGVAVWALALVAPAAFLLAGMSRLVRILTTVRGRIPRRSATLRALESLPAEITVASGITLADGRPVSELVLGSFGAVVVRELPPAAVTRVREGRWEARGARRWIALENPLDRASRDAERVRRWFGHDDADFVVKVYAVVVGSNPGVERTTTCAVVTPDRLGDWIIALPPQRSLTEGRRQRMLDSVRDAVR
jgi:hypothetical protein